jgi:predicted acyltransferase
MITNNPGASAPRALALDALRGLAILAMLLAGQLPYDQNALPSWMYHAQEPPPKFEWLGTLPGITWVDLVFPFFLFAMGAAFPLALSRRMKNQTPVWKLMAFVFERGFLLAFFAWFVTAIRPYEMSHPPSIATWFMALLGFLILFPILTRLPDEWPLGVKISVRAAGWLGAILFFIFARYPQGAGFSLGRSDIIIVVLANMAVFGALAWMLTRQNLLLRLGLLGLLFAFRLPNYPQPMEGGGWVQELWNFSPAPWIFKFYYLQYLFIVIPGTIAGDAILQWTRQARLPGESHADRSWPLPRYLGIGSLMFCLIVVMLVGLKARLSLGPEFVNAWLATTTLLVLTMCFAGWMLLQNPLNGTERLYQNLFHWAIYWLVLGLAFEPWEGGIKKDHPTLSYYFVTSGLAICVYIGFSIAIDVFQQKRWLRLLVDNGQNPMIAYAGINSFITPVLALTGASTALADLATSPWRGFWRGVIITLLMALTVSYLTRKKIFWRT